MSCESDVTRGWKQVAGVRRRACLNALACELRLHVRSCSSGDYTFIVNAARRVSAQTEKSPARNNLAIASQSLSSASRMLAPSMLKNF